MSSLLAGPRSFDFGGGVGIGRAVVVWKDLFVYTVVLSIDRVESSRCLFAMIGPCRHTSRNVDCETQLRRVLGSLIIGPDIVCPSLDVIGVVECNEMVLRGMVIIAILSCDELSYPPVKLFSINVDVITTIMITCYGLR